MIKVTHRYSQPLSGFSNVMRELWGSITTEEHLEIRQRMAALRLTFIIEPALNNAIIKLREKVSQWRKRRQLTVTDFTIISNNCWAGTNIYQPYGLKYNTPTVGLFIMDLDYIRFLERLDWYLNQPVHFISPHFSRFYHKISAGGTRPVTYPIGVIGGDVELHFLHYPSAHDALQKWQRRVERINHQHLIVKMSLRDNGYDQNEMLKRFVSLPFKHKVCFSPIPFNNPSVVHVPELATLNLVGGDESACTLRHFDLRSLLRP